MDLESLRQREAKHETNIANIRRKPLRRLKKRDPNASPPPTPVYVPPPPPTPGALSLDGIADERFRTAVENLNEMRQLVVWPIVGLGDEVPAFDPNNERTRQVWNSVMSTFAQMHRRILRRFQPDFIYQNPNHKTYRSTLHVFMLRVLGGAETALDDAIRLLTVQGRTWRQTQKRIIAIEAEFDATDVQIRIFNSANAVTVLSRKIHKDRVGVKSLWKLHGRGTATSTADRFNALVPVYGQFGPYLYHIHKKTGIPFDFQAHINEGMSEFMAAMRAQLAERRKQLRAEKEQLTENLSRFTNPIPRATLERRQAFRDAEEDRLAELRAAEQEHYAERFYGTRRLERRRRHAYAQDVGIVRDSSESNTPDDEDSGDSVSFSEGDSRDASADSFDRDWIDDDGDGGGDKDRSVYYDPNALDEIEERRERARRERARSDDELDTPDYEETVFGRTRELEKAKRKLRKLGTCISCGRKSVKYRQLLLGSEHEAPACNDECVDDYWSKFDEEETVAN